MIQNKLFDGIKTHLTAIGQTHILQFMDNLTIEQQDSLLEQANKLDFAKISAWVEKYVLADGSLKIPEQFDPAPSYPPVPQTPAQQEKYENARQLGEKMIREGKVAGFVVAGGQGTRLGFDGPKGNYPISPLRKKTLFQLFAENLLAASKKYGTTIPFYIMTSPLNHAATVGIFEDAGYFGLGRDNVILFQQGTLPNFGFDGKILMADKDQIASSPDGHGGSLKALYTSAMADLKRRGVEFLSYWQVDNPLIHPVDPLFIGLHAMDGAEMSSKALKKVGPLEKVGNFCLVDGKVTVIEYSDLPDEAAHRTNTDGSLAFELGSIGIHMINVAFIEKLNAGGDFGLPIHRAVKKIPHIDQNGHPVTPEKPNGVKLETFVFDAIPMAEHSIILQTRREEEFAPVKNATGTDSAEVTHRMMIDRAAAWLEKAGVTVPRKPDGSPDCTLEIAPSFALTAEEVDPDRVPNITPGGELYLE
jgi:UDP-N-acetylglucosamine/UDP-N-acetylgalactosamine diphosphorylase